jgi:hypothetical protein
MTVRDGLMGSQCPDIGQFRAFKDYSIHQSIPDGHLEFQRIPPPRCLHLGRIRPSSADTAQEPHRCSADRACHLVRSRPLLGQPLDQARTDPSWWRSGNLSAPAISSRPCRSCRAPASPAGDGHKDRSDCPGEACGVAGPGTKPAATRDMDAADTATWCFYGC